MRKSLYALHRPSENGIVQTFAGLLDFAAFIIWSAHATLVPVHLFHCSLQFSNFSMVATGASFSLFLAIF